MTTMFVSILRRVYMAYCEAGVCPFYCSLFFSKS